MIGKLAEMRRRQIVSHAQPYLEDGDDVRHWARAKKPSSRHEGFAYLTDRLCVVHWRGRDDGHEAVAWDDIISWELTQEARGGPLIRVQTKDRDFSVQIAVRTKQMAEAASEFLDEFSKRAPRQKRASASPSPAEGVRYQVGLTKRSVRDQTMRILVTVLGGLLVIGGISTFWVPGPWSFPIVLAGLAILASEYDWAKDAQDWVKTKFHQARQRLSARREAD